MAGTGLCSVCGTAGVMYSCSLCGKIVCGNCLTVKGACRDCMGGRKMKVDENIDTKDLAEKMMRRIGK